MWRPQSQGIIEKEGEGVEEEQGEATAEYGPGSTLWKQQTLAHDPVKIVLM
jgi:hypothetical protein